MTDRASGSGRRRGAFWTALAVIVLETAAAVFLLPAAWQQVAALRNLEHLAELVAIGNAHLCFLTAEPPYLRLAFVPYQHYKGGYVHPGRRRTLAFAQQGYVRQGCPGRAVDYVRLERAGAYPCVAPLLLRRLPEGAELGAVDAELGPG